MSEKEKDPKCLEKGKSEQPFCEGSCVCIAPAADVREHGDEVFIDLDMPGVEHSDIRIDVEDGMLKICAPCPFRRHGRTTHYHRSFQISNEIDTDGISGSLRNGVLRLLLPKSAAARRHRIQVAKA